MMRYSKISFITADEGDELFEMSDFIGVWCEGYPYLRHEKLPLEFISIDTLLKSIYPIVITLFRNTD